MIRHDSLTRRASLVVATLAFSPLMACATAEPPQELVAARTAYSQAQRGHAREYSPASLHNAKVALDGAEHKFKDDGASDTTRSQAYVALRKAQLADTDGSTAYYQRELALRNQRAMSQKAKSATQTQAELEQARQQLAAEQQARLDAEQHANDAMDKLRDANAGQIKKDSRGTIIMLPGSVLFETGKATLKPNAQSKLDKVADALKQQSDAKIIVEGHTDSTGSDKVNMPLSKKRAQSVSSYLESRGVPSSDLQTEGLGSQRPVADNDTTSGRATNRRVEIVIQSHNAQPSPSN
jgi:outer membrane protein OmpA-like peptidoglycan-associated protein